MGAVFLTGSTGFLGSFVVAEILRNSDRSVQLLQRASSDQKALERTWDAMSWHFNEEEFRHFLPRMQVLRGDLHAPGLGLSDAHHKQVLDDADSVLHIAASLNRKSDKACFNTNLRGTLSVIKLARELADRDQLERFSQVSTAAIAGIRQSEVVLDDETLDWDRSDYDPYARTKKFAEHMASELLPDVRRLVMRPTTVMGDSRTDVTYQTDMTRALVGMAKLPIIPISPDLRLDFVPGDWIARCVARLHLKEAPEHEQYNLGAGLASTTGRKIAAAMAEAGQTIRFGSTLGKPFDWTVRAMSRTPKGQPLRPIGAIMKVFWPYITYDTVFDNARVVGELGEAPKPFEDYCAAMLAWSNAHNLENPKPPPMPSDLRA